MNAGRDDAVATVAMHQTAADVVLTMPRPRLLMVSVVPAWAAAALSFV